MRYLLLGAMALTIACGGGGGGPEGPQERTLVLKPMAGLSGAVRSTGEAAEADAASVGDDGSLNSYRIVQCFDIDRIPAGAEILSATYQNEQLEVVDGPYGALGVVRLIATYIGPSLGGEDYEPLAFSATLGTLSDDARLEVKTLDVTDRVVLLLSAADVRLDLQLRFTDEHDGDLSSDYATFYAGAQAGDVPGVVVRYRE